MERKCSQADLSFTITLTDQVPEVAPPYRSSDRKRKWAMFLLLQLISPTTYWGSSGRRTTYIHSRRSTRDAIRKPTTISRPSNCNDLSALKMDSPSSLRLLFIFPCCFALKISPSFVFPQMGTPALGHNQLPEVTGYTKCIAVLLLVLSLSWLYLSFLNM